MRRQGAWSYEPFKIAALADLIASDAMFAITSGRASKMIRRTPMGQVCRWSTRPSSSSVRMSTLPTDLVSLASWWIDVVNVHKKHNQAKHVPITSLFRVYPVDRDPLHVVLRFWFEMQECFHLPGSSRFLTSRIPFSMSSNFPVLERSNRLRMLWLNSPSAADLVATSRSRAFAARISSFAAESASCIDCRAKFLESVERTARVREDILAAFAASSGDPFVRDMLIC